MPLCVRKSACDEVCCEIEGGERAFDMLEPTYLLSADCGLKFDASVGSILCDVYQMDWRFSEYIDNGSSVFLCLVRRVGRVRSTSRARYVGLMWSSELSRGNWSCRNIPSVNGRSKTL